MKQSKALLSQHVAQGGRYALLETAGGALSPGPSGSLQADIYRPLRLPVILIGDSKLGGIGATISAFESLHIRGYDVEAVTLFDDQKWSNAGYLRDHFEKHKIPTFSLPSPPIQLEDAAQDERSLHTYYEETSNEKQVTGLVELLHRKHFERVSKLFSMQAEADTMIWHPFRQHGLPQDIIAIDSAYGDHFDAYSSGSEVGKETQPSTYQPVLQSLASAPSAMPLTTSLFDGSASWWTQGLGHGNPELALTAAHAAGRYGHVMFGSAVHQPALDISHTLLSTLSNPRLSRVFFTDNGSTGMEVAVKMALRASCVRYGWDKSQSNVEVLGLSGSYHGDTIGVMNCSEPNVFNENVDWHRPCGFWFEPPSVQMKNGKWVVTLPELVRQNSSPSTDEFENLHDIFRYGNRDAHAQIYQSYIEDTLHELTNKHGRQFGALIMEPILMGAGGMIFVDPLFQRMLIRTVRETPSLIGSNQDLAPAAETSFDDWTGLPVIADEVFTGLYRLGRGSSSSFLSADAFADKLEPNIAPDISVHAKLLTGGLLPLAITTASESIFKTFLSDRKQDALLHGHSYTAHAIGCAVAEKSLTEAKSICNGPEWTAFRKTWSQAGDSNTTSAVPAFSLFSPSFLEQLSHHERIAGCFAIGTVLAMTLRSESSGYTSTAAASLQKRLLNDLDDEGAGIHSRVLGDVLYIMTSLTTPPQMVQRVEKGVMKALD